MVHEKVENMRYYILEIVKNFFEKYYPNDSEEMYRSFENKYTSLLVGDYDSEIEGLQNLIVSFKPALSLIMEPCAEYDMLLTMMVSTFKARWENAHRRKQRPVSSKKGPIMPGSDDSVSLTFHCAVCGEEIDIPYEQKMKILNSEDEEHIPTHCGQTLRIRISKQEISVDEETDEDDVEESIIPVELLIGHCPLAPPFSPGRPACAPRRGRSG